MKPALFLDRDGVVIPNIPYNKDENLVTLMPGAADLINKAHAQNYLVILASNQSALGRGWMTWDEYHAVTNRVLELLKQQGAYFDSIKVAPYHESSKLDWALRHPEDRKPSPGMLIKAQSEFNIDMPNSIMIGDRCSDILAAENAGIGRKVLLSAPYMEEEIKLLSQHKITYEKLDKLSHFQF